MVEQIEVALKYVGGGTFIIGIPARDLTAAEVKEHGGIVELCKTGLYERVAPKVEKPIKAKVTKELPHAHGLATIELDPKDGE